MRIYLAGTSAHTQILRDVHSGIFGDGNAKEEETGLETYKPYILESFYYANKETEEMIPYFEDFILDSGAFSFMENSSKRIDWTKYAEEYIKFINKHNIEKYIELDLDYIIGVEESRKLRDMLEKGTGKKSIPVWHPIRGVEEFKKMCDEYDYVALGGIVGQHWKKTEKYIPWFIKEAHKRGAKIHGLGFTKLRKLKTCRFDSVDSSTWSCGNRFGIVYQFDANNGGLINHRRKEGTRIGDQRELAKRNYIEWCKLQQWADKNL